MSAGELFAYSWLGGCAAVLVPFVVLDVWRMLRRPVTCDRCGWHLDRRGGCCGGCDL